jgi:hypothetical protein
MFLKDLKELSNEKILELLNEAQERYNKRFDIWRITKDSTDNYFMEVHLRTINNAKKILARRNIKVEFINGWEMI